MAERVHLCACKEQTSCSSSFFPLKNLTNHFPVSVTFLVQLQKHSIIQVTLNTISVNFATVTGFRAVDCCQNLDHSSELPSLSLNLLNIRRHTYEVQLHFYNPLNAELNPICYLLALLGAHHFLLVSRIRVKSLTLRLLMSYIYGAPFLDVSRSHTTTQHSR